MPEQRVHVLALDGLGLPLDASASALDFHDTVREHGRCSTQVVLDGAEQPALLVVGILEGREHDTARCHESD